MHQELEADGLPSILRHVHRLVHPGVVVRALMEDGLQNEAVAVCDVGILPVECDDVSSTGPIPEAQCASDSWHGELLIEGAVSPGLGRPAAEAIGRVARKCGISPAVRKGVGDYRRCVITVDHPAGIEAASFEAAVYDNPAITGCWCRRGGGRWSWRRTSSCCWSRARAGCWCRSRGRRWTQWRAVSPARVEF